MFKKKIFIFLPILFFLSSCGDTWQAVKKGLTNQKEKSTDEFLVKKKDPLTLPPDFENLPSPEDAEITKEAASFEKKLQTSSQSTTGEDDFSGSSSAEESILKQIRKK